MKTIRNFIFYCIEPKWKNLKSDMKILVEMRDFNFTTGTIKCRLYNPLEDGYIDRFLNANELL